MKQPFETETSPSGVKYLLPPRDLSFARHFGWLAIGGGLIGLAFISFWMWLPLAGGIKQLAKNDLSGLLMIGFSCFGLFFVFQAVRILCLGITVVTNRTQCTIEITNSHLISRERIGFGMYWNRKCRLNDIKRLTIDDRLMDDHPDTKELVESNNIGLPNWLTIRVERNGETKKGFPIAPGYLRDIIQPLADQLAERIGKKLVGRIQATPLGSPGINPSSLKSAAISVVDRTRDAEQETVFEKPEKTEVVVHDQEGQLAFEVPASGVWKGSKGLIFFSLFWLAITAFATSGLVIDWMQNPVLGWDEIVQFFVMGLFWTIGLGVLVAAVNIGKTSVMIGVLSGEQLFVERKSLFGTKWSEFDRQQIKKICRGPSNIEVNDKRIYQLQIHTTDGNKTGLLTQLTDAELEWIASVLRNELSISKRSDGASWKSMVDPHGDLVPPLDSKIAVKEMGNQTQIDINPLGIRLLDSYLLTSAGILGAAVIPFFLMVDSVFLAVVIAAGISLIGAGILIGRAIYLTRRFQLNASLDELNLQRTDCFGEKQMNWPAQEIQWIDVNGSGAQANGVEIMHVLIKTRSGSTFGMMLGRPDEELAYVAGLLNRRMGLKGKSEPSSGETVQESADEVMVTH